MGKDRQNEFGHVGSITAMVAFDFGKLLQTFINVHFVTCRIIGYVSSREAKHIHLAR